MSKIHKTSYQPLQTNKFKWKLFLKKSMLFKMEKDLEKENLLLARKDA